MGALVIREWRADTRPIDEHRNYIKIVGRNSGIIAWLLARFGNDGATTYCVGRDKMEFRSDSVFGASTWTIPLHSISSTFSGYRKDLRGPILIVAVGLVLSSGRLFFSSHGVLGALLYQMDLVGGLGANVVDFGTLAVAIVAAVIYYALNKVFTVGVIENGGATHRLRVKRSVIEGQSIDEEQAHRIALITQMLVDAHVKRVGRGGSRVPEAQA